MRPLHHGLNFVRPALRYLAILLTSTYDHPRTLSRAKHLKREQAGQECLCKNDFGAQGPDAHRLLW